MSSQKKDVANTIEVMKFPDDTETDDDQSRLKPPQILKVDEATKHERKVSRNHAGMPNPSSSDEWQTFGKGSDVGSQNKKPVGQRRQLKAEARALARSKIVSSTSESQDENNGPRDR